MAMFVLVLAMIAGLAGFVGSVWLLVHAFKKSLGWGLASFFIPFVMYVFGFMNWSESKKPTLLSLCGSAAAVGLFIVGSVLMAAQMGQEMAAQFEEEMAREMERQAQAMEQSSDSNALNFDSSEPVQVPSEPLDDAALEDKLARIEESIDSASNMALEDDAAGELVLEAIKPPSAQKKTIPLNQAAQYEGAVVRVKGRNGMRAKGRLLRVTRQGLTIERTLGSGTVSFEIARSDIKGLELIRR